MKKLVVFLLLIFIIFGCSGKKKGFLPLFPFLGSSTDGSSSGNAAESENPADTALPVPATLLGGEAIRETFTPGSVIVEPKTLMVSEAGTSATFTVVLGSKPSTNVLISGISSSNTAEVTIDTSNLTFTPANWNVPQTITVTGVNDAIQDGSKVVTVNLGVTTSAALEYDFLPVDAVEVTNVDDDTAGITVSPKNLTTTETGGKASFSVVLNTQPTSDVSIDVTSSNNAEGTVDVSSLTFTSGNYNLPQVVEVTGVDDLIPDGNIVYTIDLGSAVSSDSNYGGKMPDAVTVTNLDNDNYGINISKTTVNVIEGGSMQTFTISLTAPPVGGDAILPITNSNTNEYTASVNGLTFTTSNWNVPQTVGLIAIDDQKKESRYSNYTLGLGQISNFGNYDPPDVAVVVEDNDNAGVSVSNISGNTTESGGTATFTVALKTKPTADVTINVSSSNTNLGTVTSGATLTFTSTNWKNPKTVTITGKDDNPKVDNDDDSSSYTYNIITSDCISTDPDYTGIVVPDFTISNTDNDNAGFTVSGNPLITTDDGSVTDKFGVMLNTMPRQPVTINLSVTPVTEGSIDKTSLTFDSSNWNKYQIVTVTGQQPISTARGNKGYTIVTSAATSADAKYNGLNPTDVSVTNCDVGAATQKIAFCKTGNGEISMAERQSPNSTSVYVFTTGTPTANITLNGLTSSDTTEATVPASVNVNYTHLNRSTCYSNSAINTAANNNPAVAACSGGAGSNRFNVTAPNDFEFDGSKTSTISWSAATSSDSNYNNFTPVNYPNYNSTLRTTFPVTTTDNERVIFVTSGTYNGNLGGVTGANTKCQTSIPGGYPSGTYKALVKGYSFTSNVDYLTASPTTAVTTSHK